MTTRPRKIFLIWFSNNPEVFLGEQNKERLITLRNRNPDAEISLVYAKSTLSGTKLLSSRALTEMEEFCEEHRVKPVELNEDLPGSNIDPLEYKIHVMINEELDKWIDKTGGNPAAASDMARLKKAFLKKYGI